LAQERPLLQEWLQAEQGLAALLNILSALHAQHLFELALSILYTRLLPANKRKLAAFEGES
jgi:hypothetical protein